VPSALITLSSSEPSSPSSESPPISTSSESLDLFEYCESPRRGGSLASSFSGMEMVEGNGDAGSGRWLARAPKLARVGVVASSRCIMGCVLGAVLGRGVVGVVSSAFRKCASGASEVLTGRKVVIVMNLLNFVLRVRVDERLGMGQRQYRRREEIPGLGPVRREEVRTEGGRWPSYQRIRTYEMTMAWVSVVRYDTGLEPQSGPLLSSVW
jgi:hypothetical protein